MGPTGRPELEPLEVTADGRTALYPGHSPAQLSEVVTECLAESSVEASDPVAVVDHGSSQQQFPLPASFTGRSTVVGGCGWRRPTHSFAVKPRE